MSVNKSTELISSLSNSETKSFETYLQSPFFECQPETEKLFKQLIKNKNSNRSELFKNIFPHQSYDDKKMRYLFSDLNKHLQNFIMLTELDKNKLQSKIIQARALGLRNSDKAYSLVNKEISKSDNYKNALYFKQQFEHSEWHLNFSNQKATRKLSPDYGPTLFNLDAFYISKKLQLACEVTNMANILHKKYDICMLNEIRTVAREKPQCEIPVIKIYNHILETLLQPDSDEDFKSVQILLVQYGRKILPAELSEMFQYTRNYCVQKINRGDTEYVRILFDIYNNMLDNKPLMKHEFLSQWEFKNIVTISLRLGEQRWCENFIKRYINHLSPHERKNALAYNMAYYYFSKNDFHSAVRKLQEVELNDVFYQLDSRVILLKSYFELDDIDTFFYQVSSFRLFLLRNKQISDYQRIIYKNLIRYLSAIVRAGTSNAKLKKIKAKIESEKNVADLKWLMQKVDMAIG